MPLTHITLTGIEASVPLHVIREMVDDYPQLELGVLYRATKQGQGRYPTTRWLYALLDTVPAARLALHVCGDAAYELLAGADAARNLGNLLTEQGHLGGILPEFGRIQLNVSHATRPVQPEGVEALCALLPDTTFITQHNPDNAALTAALRHVRNHQLLFDASLGKGLVPGVFPAPIEGKVCGYAGGLGPHNLEELLPRIEESVNSVPDYAPYWIDMEARIRTPDDCFSLVKAREVLAICAPYLARRSQFGG